MTCISDKKLLWHTHLFGRDLFQHLWSLHETGNIWLNNTAQRKLLHQKHHKILKQINDSIKINWPNHTVGQTQIIWLVVMALRPSHRWHSKVCSYLRLYSEFTSLAPYSHTVQNPFPYKQLSCWVGPDLLEIFLPSGLLFTYKDLHAIFHTPYYGYSTQELSYGPIQELCPSAWNDLSQPLHLELLAIAHL